MPSSATPTRPWKDQPLPAPLLPADLAALLTVGLLRKDAATASAVAAGPELVAETLDRVGIRATRLLLTGPSQVNGADVCYLTDLEGAAQFDELLGQVLTSPALSATEDGTWLRQRTLAAARLLALEPGNSYISLPEVDASWQPPTGKPADKPTLLRWLLLALPLPALGFAVLDAYIWNAGTGFPLWPLLLLPLLGSLAFGWVLFRRLRGWRETVARAWLARPSRLRPGSEEVAARLTRAPWALLWQPPLLLLTAFVVVILLLATRPVPTLGLMLGPVAVALLLQVVLAWWQGKRYLQATQALVQGLPPGLVPTEAAQGPLWQLYRYY